jgi:WD40 repeat protein
VQAGQRVLEAEINASRAEAIASTAQAAGTLIAGRQLTAQAGVALQATGEAYQQATAEALVREQLGEARDQVSLGLSRQLAAQALVNMDRQFDLAALLSVEAAHWADTAEARSALLLSFQTNPYLLRYLRGHTGPVQGVAFSPDGRWLASASTDHTVILWDTGTLRPVGQPLAGHDSVVTGVAFSPDSRLLASSSWDDTLRLWDVATQQLISPPLVNHSDGVISVAFSPDGAALAAGGGDGTIRLWDVTTRQPEDRPFAGHSYIVSGLAFSPDGKTLASSGYDNTIRLWDVATGRPKGEPISLPLPPLERNSPKIVHAVVTCLAFSPDGRLLASGSGDTLIRIWDVVTRELIHEPLEGHSDLVASVAFSPDGKMLASSSWDNTVRLWNVAGGWPISTLFSSSQVVRRGPLLDPDNEGLFSVAFSPDGATLVAAGVDHALLAWNVLMALEPFSAGTNPALMTHPPFRQVLDDQLGAVASIAISPDGRTVAASLYDHTIRLWDTVMRQPLEPPLLGHENGVLALAFSPDGRVLASGDASGGLLLWDASTRQPLGDPIYGHTNRVVSLAFSPDGKLLASGSWDTTIRLWDVMTRQPIDPPLLGHREIVTSIAFSPDGKRLVSGSWDNTVRLWDVNTHQSLGSPLQFPTDPETSIVTSVAFSPDGDLIVSNGGNGFIRFWDAAMGQLRGSPIMGYAYNFIFSPEGQVLFSSFDNSIFLWGVANRLPVGRSLPAGNHLAASSDGKTLASGYEADLNMGAIFLWDFRLETWQALICDRVTRNLTQAEWEHYLPGQPYHKTCEQWPEGK